MGKFGLVSLLPLFFFAACARDLAKPPQAPVFQCSAVYAKARGLGSLETRQEVLAEMLMILEQETETCPPAAAAAYLDEKVSLECDEKNCFVKEK